ncbi:MAG: hypothetical protein ISS36_00290 [Candidatus Aenigmarchaeota archaeon]|nr:hypothetical protein [Candidatus Aenigmarchaeota archaeon]
MKEEKEVVTAGEDAQKPAEAPEKKEESKKGNAEAPATKKPNYVYLALFLHSANKEITEENIKKLSDSIGEKADDAQLKALVSSLEGIDINDAISQAIAAPAAAAPVGEVKEEKKEEKKEEDAEKKSEEAAAGLSSLFS